MENEVDITNEGVAIGAPKVHEPASGKQRDAFAIGEDELVDLRLHVNLFDLGVFLEPRNIDFAIKVADIAHNGLILHGLHMLGANDIEATGCR